MSATGKAAAAKRTARGKPAAAKRTTSGGPAAAKRTATRLTADARREAVLDAALPHFAQGGLHGTSTEAIARDAGVSQPYLFRLFGTKRELFLACHRLCCTRVLGAFEAAAQTLPAGAPPEERLHAMGQAYKDLIADRDLLRMQMQGYVAAEDPEVRAAARGAYGELFRFVQDASGAPDEAVLGFFATGMLLNVSASMSLARMDPGEPEAWAASLRRGR